jgi:hypothetical protein
MNIYLVVENVDLGYHVHAAFFDENKAKAHRQHLSDTDGCVQRRKAAGDPYYDNLYDVEEVEVSE